MENTIRRSEMLNNENIYNVEKYKLQIQKYALCCDDFRDGVYKPLKTKPF